MMRVGMPRKRERTMPYDRGCACQAEDLGYKSLESPISIYMLKDAGSSPIKIVLFSVQVFSK